MNSITRMIVIGCHEVTEMIINERKINPLWPLKEKKE